LNDESINKIVNRDFTILQLEKYYKTGISYNKGKIKLMGKDKNDNFAIILDQLKMLDKQESNINQLLLDLSS